MVMILTMVVDLELKDWTIEQVVESLFDDANRALGIPSPEKIVCNARLILLLMGIEIGNVLARYCFDFDHDLFLR